MIGQKEIHYQGKSKGPSDVQAHLEEYLKKDGFEVQTSAPSDAGTVIQAKKGGFLRGMVDADRALTITIKGSADDFIVKVGIGKWWQDLGVAAVETLFVSEIFLVVDIADSAWNLEIEDKLIKDLNTFVG